MPGRAAQPRSRWSDASIRALIRDRIAAGRSLRPDQMKADGFEYVLKVVARAVPGGWRALVAAEGGSIEYARDYTALGAEECRARLLDRAARGRPLHSAAMQSRDDGDPLLFRWARRHFARETNRWDDVLRAVGLDPAAHRRARARTPDDDPYPLLVEIWGLVAAGHSLVPAHVDSGLYQKAKQVCGGWSAALELAGIDPALAFVRGPRLTGEEVQARLAERQRRGRSLHCSVLSQEDPLLLRSARACAGTRRWPRVLRHFGIDPAPHVSAGTRDMRAGQAFEVRARRLLRRLRPHWRKPRPITLAHGDEALRCCPDLVDTTGPELGPEAEWIDLKLRAGGKSYEHTVAKYRRAGVRLRIVVLETVDAVAIPEGVTVQSIFDLEPEANTLALKAQFAALRRLAAAAPTFRGCGGIREWTTRRLRARVRAMPPEVLAALRGGDVAPARRHLRETAGGVLGAICARYGNLARGLVKLGVLDAPPRPTRSWRTQRAWRRELRRLLERRVAGGQSIRAKAVKADHPQAYQKGRELHGSWERALQVVARQSPDVQAALALPQNAGRPREFLRDADLPVVIARFIRDRAAQGQPLSSMACRQVWPMLVSRAVMRAGRPWRAIVAAHLAPAAG